VEDTRQAIAQQIVGELPLVAVRVDWTEVNALDPRHINQLAVQLGSPTPDGIPDGVYLAVGALTPPILQVSDAETARKLADELKGTSLTVVAHGRFHMSRGLVDVLIRLLQVVAEQYDSLVEQAAAAKARERGQE
jgi:hypothetical protein